MSNYNLKKGLIGYLSAFTGLGTILFLGVTFTSAEVWDPLSTSEGSQVLRFVWFVTSFSGWAWGYED